MPQGRRTPMPREAIDYLRDEQQSNSAIGKVFGVHHDVVARWRRELPGAPEPDEEPDNPDSRGVLWHIPEQVSFENGLWRALETVQQEYVKREVEQHEVDVALPDDLPVLVVFQSDLHLGHTECRMDRLRQDLETIRNTEGLYVILGGDLFDNVVTSVATRGSYHEQLTPLRFQQQLVEEFVEYLGAGNILAMVLGNHDAWSIRDVDYDPVKYLARKVGCPYLGAWGFINLALGSQHYRVLAAHQFRLASGFNKTHSAKRMSDMLGDADVVFTGHRHAIAAEQVEVRQQHRFFAQAGTYMRTSRYGRGLGFGDSTPEMPGVLLWPKERRLLGIYDGLSDGPWMLKAAREEYAKQAPTPR